MTLGLAEEGVELGEVALVRRLLARLPLGDLGLTDADFPGEGGLREVFLAARFGDPGGSFGGRDLVHRGARPYRIRLAAGRAIPSPVLTATDGAGTSPFLDHPDGKSARFRRRGPEPSGTTPRGHEGGGKAGRSERRILYFIPARLSLRPPRLLASL